jgi:hypothetical protein
MQQNTRTTTRQLDDGHYAMGETDGSNSTPEVKGTDPVAAVEPPLIGTDPAAAAGPPPTGIDTVPANGDPDAIANDSGTPPEYVASAPALVGAAPALDTPETATDPCDDADSCEACQTAAASVTETGKTCWWDDSYCSKTVLDASHVTAEMCRAPPAAVVTPEPPTDPCVTVTDSCEACQAAAASVTEIDKTCWWENGTCTKVSNERDAGTMCVVPAAPPSPQPTVSPTHAPSPHPTLSSTESKIVVPTVVVPPVVYPDEEEGLGMDTTKMIGCAFVGLIILLAIRSIRNRCCNRNAGAGGMRSSKQSGRYQEM